MAEHCTRSTEHGQAEAFSALEAPSTASTDDMRSTPSSDEDLDLLAETMTDRLANKLTRQLLGVDTLLSREDTPDAVA